MKDKDLIYHLGGVNRGSEEEVFNGNAFGTLRLVQAIKCTGKPTRIIFASSSQVYKPPRKNLPLVETHAAEPDTLYGISKKAAEDFIRLSGQDYIILRLANVYGPGCRPNYNSVIATFCHRAVSSLPLVIKGDGKQGRDFVYIDDVIKAFLLAREQKGKSNIYNISSGKVTSLRKVLKNILRVLPQTDVIYDKDASGDNASYCCDNSRFVKQYCWKPQSTLRKGIENIICQTKEKA